MKKILAVVLLVLLISALSVSTQELITTGEKAEYVFLLAGKDAGYSKFAVTQGEEYIFVITGETKVIAPKTTALIKSISKVGSDLKFRELKFDYEVSGAQSMSGTVVSTFKEGTIHTVISPQNIEKDTELAGDYLVIANNVFEHSYFALKKFLVQGKNKMVYKTFSPNVTAVINVSLTKKEVEKIKIGEKEVDALHIIMGIGPQIQDFWVHPKTHVIQKMIIKAQQFEMVLKE